MPFFRFYGVIVGPKASSPASRRARGGPLPATPRTPGTPGATNTPTKGTPSKVRKSPANSLTWVPRVYHVSHEELDRRASDDEFGSRDRAVFHLWCGVIGHEVRKALGTRNASTSVLCQIWAHSHPLPSRFSAAQAQALLEGDSYREALSKGIRVSPKGTTRSQKEGLWLEKEELTDMSWVEVVAKVEQTRSPKLAKVQNPYLTEFRKMMAGFPPDFHNMFDSDISNDRREELYNMEDPEIIQKYCWAVPDERALKIIANFTPILEIGAGSGYWAHLLSAMGVDIIATDKYTHSNPDNHFLVHKGGPEIAADHPDRALLLCYPDDFEMSEESVGLAALEAYEGDTIIHIGELFPNTICLPHAWGRTSGPDFQVHLASSFHMVLSAPLPRWSTSRDYISVWKRTRTVSVDDEVYASIPQDEQIDVCVASSKYAALLK